LDYINSLEMTTLYYIHDPMCSWCWGFKPVWTKLQSKLPSKIKVKYLLGGLAKDSAIPMPLSLQSTIQATWHTIQHEIPGINFNFDFWTSNEPRRSTYPACRAVIAARKQNANLHLEMIDKIQRAYYLEALNPSDNSVLIKCAESLNLNIDIFTKDISSKTTQAILDEEINISRELGAQGFPSLVLTHNDNAYFVTINYNNEKSMLDNIKAIIKNSEPNP